MIAERKSDGKYSQVWKHDFGDNSIVLVRVGGSIEERG